MPGLRPPPLPSWRSAARSGPTALTTSTRTQLAERPTAEQRSGFALVSPGAALAYDWPVSDAGSIACGAEITQDTILGADLACDHGPALVIVADGVTLDLGGHTVSGAPDFSAEGPGILLRGVNGCTVRNGTVQHFEAGVAVEAGAGNVIEDLVVQDHLGNPDGDFGYGIVINNSRNNTVRRNVVRRNGPFSG